jgi:hypothetical protein
MRRIVFLFMLSLALLLSPSANAAGFRGGGSMHTMHSEGFRGGFAGRGHFRGEHFGGHFEGRGDHLAGHFRGAFFVGPVFWDPFWWDYPSPYYPATVIEQQPVEYITTETPAAGHNYWYFCKSSEAYYPYVKQCAAGWVRVVPAPPQ